MHTKIFFVSSLKRTVSRVLINLGVLVSSGNGFHYTDDHFGNLIHMFKHTHTQPRSQAHTQEPGKEANTHPCTRTMTGVFCSHQNINIGR